MSDTANYGDSADAVNPQPASLAIWQRQMQYLAQQKTALNLVFAVHAGGVVAHGDLYDAEWQSAKSAVDVLAATGLPFGMAPGEQDYDNSSHTAPGNRPVDGARKWNQYFGSTASYFAGKAWYGGAFTNGLDSFQTFNAGGQTFLHLSLELEASDDAIAWAAGVLETHPGVPTLLTTHEYLGWQNNTNGQALYLDEGYRAGLPSNNAQNVWNKLIAPHDQIFLVLCGHSFSTPTNGISSGENLRTDLNAAGHPVYQVLTDFEGNTCDALGDPGVLAGGAGWLRLITFDAQAGTMHFQTHSTELAQDAGQRGGPTFNLPAWMSDFTLPLPARVFPQPARWSFGIITDTQWTVPDDGWNPDSIPANILQQVHRQFIDLGVNFVLGLGDLVDLGTQANDYARALYVQDLYNAGIGFYPTRGNHESGAPFTGSGAAFRHVYPQIVPGPNPGFHNTTPPDVTVDLITPAPDLANVPPAPESGSAFAVGVNCSAPTAVNATNDSVSYAFDYNNTTVVLLDQFCSPDPYASYLPQQQDWIHATLAARPANTHAFVCTHKDLLGGDHKDNMFGNVVAADDPGDGSGVDFNSLSVSNQTALIAKTNAQNAFLASMQSNRVHYVFCGHDHHHYNSIVTSPDQQSRVHQLICTTAGSKFYSPTLPVSTNDLPVEQEGGLIGYYVVTIEGPHATIDYYADTTPGNYEGPFHFAKRSSTGYSLNGREFVVPEGSSYNVVADDTTQAVANGETGYLGTRMRLLGGTNTSLAANNYGKPQVHAVNTGWAPALPGSYSDTLTLWGLAGIAASQYDAIPISLSYTAPGLSPALLATGLLCLATVDTNGNWINAVDANLAGGKTFVNGAWNPGYGLGCYGVDTATQTAWAVVNRAASFAVVLLPPTLTIAPPDAGGDLSLSWPANFLTSYVLQYCPELGSTNWVTLTNQSPYALKPGNQQGFFRLQRGH